MSDTDKIFVFERCTLFSRFQGRVAVNLNDTKRWNFDIVLHVWLVLANNNLLGEPTSISHLNHISRKKYYNINIRWKNVHRYSQLRHTYHICLEQQWWKHVNHAWLTFKLRLRSQHQYIIWNEMPLYYHSFHDLCVLWFFWFILYRSYDYIIMKIYMAKKSYMNLGFILKNEFSLFIWSFVI